MPLQILWKYTVLDSWDEIIWPVKAMVILGYLSLAVTAATVITWAVRENRATNRLLSAEGRLMSISQVRVARTVNIFPLYICATACTGLFAPATYYAVQLGIAIAASVVIGSLVHAFVRILGEPPVSERLLERTEKKRWWFHPLCGGANDLWCMGFLYSKEARSLTSSDIRRAHFMVQLFMFVFIASSYAMTVLSLIPSFVSQAPDGRCYRNELFPKLNMGLSALLVICSWVGSGGFAIITTAVHSILESLPDDVLLHVSQDQRKKIEYKVKEKACAVQLYLLLALLAALLSLVPLHSDKLMIAVPLELNVTKESPDSDNWISRGTLLHCPIYDKEVLTSQVWCFFVSIAMAWLSLSNYRHFPPGETSSQQLLLNLSAVSCPKEREQDNAEALEQGENREPSLPA